MYNKSNSEQAFYNQRALWVQPITKNAQPLQIRAYKYA